MRYLMFVLLFAFGCAKNEEAPKTYEYAPVTIFESGKYHTFFCSETDKGTDSIRYRVTTDNVDETSKQRDEIFTPTWERCACDPDILKVNDTYHLYYTGCLDSERKKNHLQAIVMVASGPSITGPFTNRRAIIFNPYGDLFTYGAGQSTAVLMPSGEIWMWYTAVSNENNDIWFTKSTDPRSFPQGVKTNLSTSSVGVTLNESTGVLEMYYLDGSYTNPGGRFAYRTSTDGITWSSVTYLGQAPAFAFDAGIVKNNQGRYDGTFTRTIKTGLPVGAVTTFDEVFKVTRKLYTFFVP